jgi:hypothetical protein
MTVTIYTTNEAMETVFAIKDLDHYDRCCLADSEETDLTRKPGYYLKPPTSGALPRCRRTLCS